MSRRVKKGIDDLETLYPDLAKEWHPTLNGELLPRDVLPGSNRKVYWKCPKCNYEWKAQICNRAKGRRGCPCCSNKVVVKGVNDLATTHPELAKEWYQPLNGKITPYDVTHGCGKKFSWICPRGHIYTATVLHRTNGVGTKCPVCNSGRQTSFAEQALYYYIKKVFPDAINGYKDIFSKSMELDIYIPDLKIGIEYDGVYWHHKKETSYERENRKYNICKDNGIKLIRVREKRKYENEMPAADFLFYVQNDKNDEKVLSGIIKEVINKVLSMTKNKHGNSIVIDIDITRDKFEILSYLKGPVKNSLQEVAPELVNEWDFEKNGNLNPNMVAAGSSHSVYWLCSKCGYSWKATIYSRAKMHTGCPKCAGFVFEKGVNDLKTKKPELLIDWDYEGNAKNNIFPDEIIFNSGKKVKWICHICGHKWTTSLNKRTVNGNGCIKCGYKLGKKLKQKRLLDKQGNISNKLLLKEWDYDRNSKIGLYPEELTEGSNKYAYWICSKCGHKWKAPISRRSKGAGCRKCADKANPDLKRKLLIKKGHVLDDKLLLKEWDYEKNAKKPQDFTFGSGEKVHWVCSKCGYKWSAIISSRHKGAGCPACAGNILIKGKNDLATVKPELAKEWDYKKNININPSQVSYSSSHKYWWVCPKGHESYLASPSHRINGTGCPICGNIKAGEKNSRMVDQLTLSGEYIKTFKSLRAASEACGLSNGAISNAIRKGTTSGGYRWRHHNKEK